MNEPHHQHKKPADAPRPILGFAAGTPIRTPEGSKPIEDVKPGDLIGSAPGAQVQEVFQTEQPVFLLHLGGTVIRTTAEHPFYVPGKGWITAAEMSEATNDGEDSDRLEDHDDDRTGDDARWWERN
jgi:hypothetical protein